MPMGMVVGDDDGGGVVFERLGEDQPGVDLSGVDAALEHGRAVQELAPIVQAEQDDRLVLQPEKPGQQIVAEILRTGQDDAVLVLVLIIPPEQLAAKAEMSRSHLSAIEAPNIVRSFSVELLFNIADALEVEPGDLLSASMIPEQILNKNK